jgi:hypothetical protein
MMPWVGWWLVNCSDFIKGRTATDEWSGRLQLQDPNLWLPRWKRSTEIAGWLWEVAEEVGISILVCHMILTEDLGMHWSLSKNFDWWSETAMIFHLWKSPKSTWSWKSFEKCHCDYASPQPKKAQQVHSWVKALLLKWSASILTGLDLGFLLYNVTQFIQANDMVIPQIRQLFFPSTSLLIHYSLSFTYQTI